MIFQAGRGSNPAVRLILSLGWGLFGRALLFLIVSPSCHSFPKAERPLLLGLLSPVTAAH